MEIDLRDRLSYARTVNRNNFNHMAFSEEHDVLFLVYSSEQNTPAYEKY